MEAEYRKRAKKCAKCNEPLSGTAIEALSNTWHQKCFVCTSCEKPFQDSKFVNIENKPYCQPCGRKAFASNVKKNKPETISDSNPNCGKCEKPCSGDTVEALGQSFHTKCFTCAQCDKPFAGKKFLNVDNKPYCEQCGKKAFVSSRMRKSASASSEDLTSANNGKKEDPKDARQLDRSQSVMLTKPAQEIRPSAQEAPPATSSGGQSISQRLASLQKNQEKQEEKPAAPAPTRSRSQLFNQTINEENKASPSRADDELEEISRQRKVKRQEEEEKEAKKKKDDEEEESRRKRDDDERKAKLDREKKEREEKKKREEEEREAEEAKLRADAERRKEERRRQIEQEEREEEERLKKEVEDRKRRREELRRQLEEDEERERQELEKKRKERERALRESEDEEHRKKRHVKRKKRGRRKRRMNKRRKKRRRKLRPGRKKKRRKLRPGRKMKRKRRKRKGREKRR